MTLEDHAIWMQRQRLPRKAASVADAIRSGGWMHTGGGTGAYVAMFARVPEFARATLDSAAFVSHEVLELPAVRDATMLVPAADASLALAIGRRAFAKRLANFARQCDVTDRELRRLAERILVAIDSGARASDQIRAELPARSVRDLGEAGRKLGATSTLPLALRQLQGDGAVLRAPEDQHLNAKGYVYDRWPAAVPLQPLPETDEEIDRELARRYAEWAAPVTVEDFAWWADLPKRRAAAAFASGKLSATAARGVLLLPFRDNYLYLHRGLQSFVDDPSGVEALDWNGRAVPIEELDSLHTNAIVVDGELRGIWEWDPNEHEIAWRTFRPASGRVRSAIENEVEAVGSFIGTELGDHRFYPFDTARTRGPRIAFARAET